MLPPWVDVSGRPGARAPRNASMAFVGCEGSGDDKNTGTARMAVTVERIGAWNGSTAEKPSGPGRIPALPGTARKWPRKANSGMGLGNAPYRRLKSGPSIASQKRIVHRIHYPLYRRLKSGPSIASLARLSRPVHQWHCRYRRLKSGPSIASDKVFRSDHRSYRPYRRLKSGPSIGFDFRKVFGSVRVLTVSTAEVRAVGRLHFRRSFRTVF